MNSRAGSRAAPYQTLKLSPGARKRGRAEPMSGFAVEPDRRTVSECLRAAKSPVWHARPARMPYSQEAAEHDLGFRFSLLRETRPKFVEMCQTDDFAAHRQAKPCGGGRESTSMTNVSLVNVPKTVPKSYDLEKTPDEIPRDAEQDKRTGSAPHPSPVVLSECGKSKDSDSDGRNSQRKH